MNTKELINKNLICKVMAGSHSYGTNTEDSDVDMRGIFCADPINLLTPFFPVREIGDEIEEDTKYFELSHFSKLLVEQNPNIIEQLWVREEDVLISTPSYAYLRAHREDFLSSKIAFTTSGYAHSQLKRIKGHNKWINNPQPERAPQERDYISIVQWFGENKMLPSAFTISDYEDTHRAIPYGNNLFGLYEMEGGLFRPDGSVKDNYHGNRSTLPQPLAVIKLNKDQHRADKDVHTNYWKWKKNRNEARAELEEDHGFDTKHAMHLVRLLKMGLETLTTGKVEVFRQDAEELLAIRNGSMEYDELIEYANEMDSKIKIAYNETSLRKKVNIEVASQHVMHAQQLTWNENVKT